MWGGCEGVINNTHTHKTRYCMYQHLKLSLSDTRERVVGMATNVSESSHHRSLSLSIHSKRHSFSSSPPVTSLSLSLSLSQYTHAHTHTHTTMYYVCMCVCFIHYRLFSTVNALLERMWPSVTPASHYAIALAFV